MPFATEGEPTARSLIQVTPDGERTMNTFLGISAFLNPGDIDQEIVESAAITYCEGYLWDRDEAKARSVTPWRSPPTPDASCR